MRFSMLTPESASRDIIDAFGGYNHNVRIGENEFYDMQNLTSDNYPILSPRKNRGIYNDSQFNVDGLLSKDSLCYIRNCQLYINGDPVEGLELTTGKKQLISMGAYIIILPDKKYYNTVNSSDKGDIEASYESESDVSFSLCKVDGQKYSISGIASPTAPENPTNMQLWIDTANTPNVLKQYSKESEMWVTVPTTYVKISSPGIGAAFKQYDGVKISGIDTSITALKDLGTDLNGKNSPIWALSDDSIVVVGMLSQEATQSEPVKVERTMPEMDFVIESGNRLWGCRYGLNAEGEAVNEIYASKLGDFKNFNCFMGISTDSYTASCGTDGQFTGAITYLGYPIFFKENCLHKVYGNYPANYQIQTTTCRGVQKGAGKSLAIVNETLFYKSRSGVCMYDGSLPSEISANFGDVHYSAVDSANEDFLRNGAVAGAHRNKYYISMMSEVDDKWYLFVYDTLTRLWHKEDNLRVDEFCSNRDELYYISNDAPTTIGTILGSGTKDSQKVYWNAETGVIGTSMPDKKYITRLAVRMSLEIGTRVMFFAQYDSCGEWEHLATIHGKNLQSFTVPIKPKRCDHLRLRIEGIGVARIFSITKTIEQGSDM